MILILILCSKVLTFFLFVCSKFYSDLIMMVSASMSVRERNSERAHFEILNAKHRSIHFILLEQKNQYAYLFIQVDPDLTVDFYCLLQ